MIWKREKLQAAVVQPAGPEDKPAGVHGGGGGGADGGAQNVRKQMVMIARLFPLERNNLGLFFNSFGVSFIIWNWIRFEIILFFAF